MVLLLTLAFQDSRATTLEQAVEDGVVEASIVSSNTFGRLALTLTSVDGPTMVLISPGTRFVSDTDSSADVVAVGATEILVRDSVVLDPLEVISLAPDKSLPSPISAARYEVGEKIEGDVLSILEQADAIAAPGNYGVQLAVWSITQNEPLDQIVANLPAPPSEADVAAARQLLGTVPSGEVLDQTTINPPSPTSEEVSEAETEGDNPTVETTPEASVSLPLGSLFVGVVGLALLAALAATGFSAMKKRERAEPEPAPKAPDAGSGAPIEPRPATKRDVTTTLDPNAVEKLTLKGLSGPHAGRKLIIDKDTVLARSSLSVQVVEERGLSSPHLYLFWSDSGVLIKDLNSAKGTVYGDLVLGNRKVEEVPFGQSVTVAGNLTLVVSKDGAKIGNRKYPAAAGGMLLTQKPLSVVALGNDDRGISDPHCLITREGSHFKIMDLNSTNGVKVDGRQLENAAVAIPPDSKIELGGSVFG